jgi:hypothetical protein
MAIILTGSTGVATPAVVDASGGNTATINSMTPTADSLQGFRNRIINGDMRIDQRNAGASVTPSIGTYTLDRWGAVLTQTSKFSVQQNAGSVTPPTGFTNYLGVTSLSAYSVLTGDTFLIEQRIEGFNVADLGFGTANAKTVTLSFWVRSSLTGTFGGAIVNSAANRSYTFSYTISSANTWEQKSVTIAGDTTGTWLTNNGVGLNVRFGLGSGSTFTQTAGSWGTTNAVQPPSTVSVVGTNGATWYVTGVQLEVGSVATPFERRDYGRELMLCQRYYYKFKSRGVGYFGCGTNNGTTNNIAIIPFPVSMRTHPTALEQSGTAGDYQVQQGGTNITCSAVAVYNYADTDSATVQSTVASGLTIGYAAFLRAVNSSAYLAWSAEL